MTADPDIPAFAGSVTRLGTAPLIAETLFGRSEIAGLEPDALANINGPSLVRMPDWAAGRRGAYHLYFAHHKGKSIRLAHADELARPLAHASRSGASCRRQPLRAGGPGA